MSWRPRPRRCGLVSGSRPPVALAMIAWRRHSRTLHQFAEQARDLGASRIMAVATEAARAAANGPAFLDQIARETGIDVRVIDGEEEAALTFRGLAASADVTGDLLVADVGGGSTEIIVASDGQVRAARSLPLGSGRLTDRLVTTDPPTAAALADCRDVAAADLAPLATSMAWPTGTPTRLIVVGGTGEYLARLVPDGQRMTAATIGMVLERLQRLPAAELATTIGVVEARARVLPAGVAVVAAITDLMQPGWIGSARSGIRAGMLLAMLKPEPNSGSSQ